MTTISHNNQTYKLVAGTPEFHCVGCAFQHDDCFVITESDRCVDIDDSGKFHIWVKEQNGQD